jgi:long-chain fatty acid transport protein
MLTLAPSHVLIKDNLIMLKYYAAVGTLVLSTTAVDAGGWETGRLDTGFLYQNGNYVEASYGNLDYSVNGTTQANQTHEMAKDQKRMSLSGKFAAGDFDIGLTSFGSGAIQMDGQGAAVNTTACKTALASYTAAAAAGSAADMVTQSQLMGANCSVVPSADVKLNTQALMARYSFNDKYSVIAGVRQASLKKSSLDTLAATYSIDAVNKTGFVYGLTYERPDIALKFEILRSEKITIGLVGKAASVLDVTGTLVVPAATTINFQTGIAENTLLMASAHRVNWTGSNVTLNVAASPSLNQASDFSNTTSYSLGLGRRLNEATSASITYSWEKGTNPGGESTSPFTMSNGSETLSFGVQHKIGLMTISGGVSYTKAGDVDVTHSSGLTASYARNSVTAVGIKVGYNF